MLLFLIALVAVASAVEPTRYVESQHGLASKIPLFKGAKDFGNSHDKAMVVKFPCEVRGTVDLEVLLKHEVDFFKVTADKDFSVFVWETGTPYAPFKRSGEMSFANRVLRAEVMTCEKGKCKPVKRAGPCESEKKGIITTRSNTRMPRRIHKGIGKQVKQCFRKGTYYVR
jgi:hypothetical protein